MTKKDYELIAELLSYLMPSMSDDEKHKYWFYVCHSFNETFAKNNPRFNKQKFLTACGIDNE